KDANFASLFPHIETKEKAFCPQKAAFLCDRLTELCSFFSIYELPSSSHENWTRSLWEKLSQKPGFTYPLKEQGRSWPDFLQGLTLHFFGFSFLPSVYHEFFSHFPGDVEYYLLSPSKEFWEDSLSAFELQLKRKAWAHKPTLA